MKFDRSNRASQQSVVGAALRIRPAFLGLLGLFAAFGCLATPARADAGLSGSSIAAGRRLLSGHVPHAVTSGKASSLGRLPATQNLKLAIGLALRDQAGLEEFLRELNDPSSPNYHQYLTVQEFTDQFAPTAADYQAVVDYAIANGLTVTGTSSNRLVVNAEGPVANIEQAFQVTMGSYQHPTENRAFRAPANEPTIPVGLQILHISGLDNFALPHPVNINVSPLGQLQPETSYTGSGPTGLFIGNDFRAAYAPGVTLTGSGQSVALVEFQPYVLADVTAYFKQAGLPLNVPITNVLLDGATGVYTSASGADAEAVLDIDMAIDMAPGLSQVLVYEGDPNNVIPMDVMNRIATDNIAKQISSSWMWTYDPAETQVFMEFAAQGQTYLNASGDDGAYDIFYDGQVSYCFPSEDQYVTAVGGTSLATNGAGGPWQSEVCWSVLSGGGISPDNMPIPSYQQGISSSYNQASTTLRNVPDVSANADQNMFIVFTSDGTTVTGSIGGTSAATPIWAGFIALANQQAAKNGLGSVGFLNPSVYAIGKGSNYAKDFHDITVGSNVDVQDDFNLTNYNAGTGYDLVTGWGSPTGQNLINALAGTAGSAVDFTLWSAQESMTVALGSTNTDAITVNPLFGFAGSVSLSVSGLPSGVTASFSPSSTTGTSTLTLSAATSAKTGTFALTVTGKSGGLAHTVAINLIVPSKSPDFSLTLPQNTMAIWPGEDDSESTWFFVYVNDLYGFTGNVKLSLSGLPKGVTVSYQPSSTATSLVPWSCLYLTAASSATPGTYTVTVNGASGSLTHAVTFALTITPPDFSLALIPGSISMTPGSKVSSQIYVGDIDGFSGNISYSVSGLPSGVTASFSPSSTNAGSVNFTASSKAAAGTSTVTITGKSSSLTHSVPVTLVIEPTISKASVTTTAGGPWQNTVIPAQTGTFTVTYDATASDSPINAAVGLSNGAQTAASGFAVLIRFNSSGNIDALNGGSYVASTISYGSGMTYHFRVVVNLSKHTYSAYVSVPSIGSPEEQAIGTNLSFGTAQKSVTQLNSWGASSTTGSETVTNFGY